MNKTTLKNFASNARKQLLKKIEAKAMKIGITEDHIKHADLESSDAIFIDGKQLSTEEKRQREKLITRINEIGFHQVLEEVAYTWFNRFTALRLMEVKDYLPTGVRVLSSSHPNSADPDILHAALELDLEVELDKEYIYQLKLTNQREELFKYLMIKQCNDLNRYLPFMFETIDDYAELLFPEGLLAKDSFLRKMTDVDYIPESTWHNVEIIGWLYQYYIAEEKDRVIQAKKKYKKEEIPFATQLFTPDWIVRYMVQNSLGRYWVESHPEHRELIDHWDVFFESRNSDSNTEAILRPYINKDLKIEDIKCFDPAMGSGHILVYMFDVLYEIYLKCGYIEREIPRLIIENNLYGLDIDDRAYQLACFSLVMKAMEYNQSFFRSIEREGLTLNLACIEQSNQLTIEDIEYIAGQSHGDIFDKVYNFIKQFTDAKIIGSIIQLNEFDKELIEQRLSFIQQNPVDTYYEEEAKRKSVELLPKLLKQADIMQKKYDVLVTNPPYIGNKFLPDVLREYMNNHYKDFKADLFSAFIRYSFSRVKENGHLGAMTPFVWMFISAYENLRKEIIKHKNISSLIQLEYSGFEEATVPICTFTLRNYNVDVTGEYISLSDFKGVKNQSIKTFEAVNDPTVPYRYSMKSNDLYKIPGSPIAYWASEKVREIFKESPKLKQFAHPKNGLSTTDNNRFLRNWTEVNFNQIGFGFPNREAAAESDYKWFPYNKGGAYKKWFGNLQYVVNWYKDGEEIRQAAKGASGGRIVSPEFYFNESISWSKITSGKLSLRYFPQGFIFDVAGTSLFSDKDHLLFFLGFLNSSLSNFFIKNLSQTLNFEAGHLGNMPIITANINKKEVIELVKDCIQLTIDEWNCYELSWEFKKHPFLHFKGETIEASFKLFEKYTHDKFAQLKTNEETINKMFIDAYGLQDEVTPHVEDEAITIRMADKQREVKSFISYAIGCIFGRYSLDQEGLTYAGGQFNHEQYKAFSADKDNILPIVPGAYFEDDIVSKFIDFVKVTFGEEGLTTNVNFIADALERKKGETANEAIRRYFLNDFFIDHVRTYKKRPIYWLFTSGKQKAFNCFIYMHRYDHTTLSRIRTDYLHDYQIRLDAEKEDLLAVIEGDYHAKDIRNAKQGLKLLDRKIDELKTYDELLHHKADQQIEIELDNGVAFNYELFKGLVAKL